MRLIDADRARETATIDLVVHHIDRQPTVDAVEVVRCEECKYREDCVKRIEFMGRNLVLELNTHEYLPLKFCSYGERKSGPQPQREVSE